MQKYPMNRNRINKTQGQLAERKQARLNAADNA